MLRHPGVPFVLFAFAMLCAVILGAVSGGASADYVVLTNGRTLEGEITEDGDDIVRVKVGGGTVTLPRSRIESIHRGEAQPPPSGESDEERKRIEHSGGAAQKRGEFRYLDGTDPETGDVVVTRFTVLQVEGELAHGTLVEVLQTRTVNGLPMAEIRAGKREGWVPAVWLRASVAEPVLRR